MEVDSDDDDMAQNFKTWRKIKLNLMATNVTVGSEVRLVAGSYVFVHHRMFFNSFRFDNLPTTTMLRVLNYWVYNRHHHDFVKRSIFNFLIRFHEIQEMQLLHSIFFWQRDQIDFWYLIRFEFEWKNRWLLEEWMMGEWKFDSCSPTHSAVAHSLHFVVYDLRACNLLLNLWHEAEWKFYTENKFKNTYHEITRRAWMCNFNLKL